ncbi:DUF1534 domain-containing protein [Pseudomonas caricapapayae]|nr:DUF1534 domain-containing protein [Pseudomonas caricapapayae]
MSVTIVPTLQRGNAFHDAPRHKRTQNVQNCVSTRSIGTRVVPAT